MTEKVGPMGRKRKRDRMRDNIPSSKTNLKKAGDGVINYSSRSLDFGE